MSATFDVVITITGLMAFFPTGSGVKIAAPLTSIESPCFKKIYPHTPRISVNLDHTSSSTGHSVDADGNLLFLYSIPAGSKSLTLEDEDGPLEGGLLVAPVPHSPSKFPDQFTLASFYWPAELSKTRTDPNNSPVIEDAKAHFIISITEGSLSTSRAGRHAPSGKYIEFKFRANKNQCDDETTTLPDRALATHASIEITGLKKHLLIKGLGGSKTLTLNPRWEGDRIRLSITNLPDEIVKPQPSTAPPKIDVGSMEEVHEQAAGTRSTELAIEDCKCDEHFTYLYSLYKNYNGECLLPCYKSEGAVGASETCPFSRDSVP